jgi:hypothetical protein
MRHYQEMEREIAFWVEELGYDEVLSTLITICTFWATARSIAPIEGPCELWTRRERALRYAQREGKRHALP